MSYSAHEVSVLGFASFSHGPKKKRTGEEYKAGSRAVVGSDIEHPFLWYS